MYGCTMSPVSSMELDLGHVLTVTRSKFVVYVRTNMVKLAVATVRGNLLHHVSRAAHLRVVGLVNVVPQTSVAFVLKCTRASSCLFSQRSNPPSCMLLRLP